MIKKDTLLMEYVGDAIDSKEHERRISSYEEEGIQHHFFMEVLKDYVIDATKSGNISRFINHSCEPNAMTEKWTVKGVVRIAFVAIKDIQPGEEITFDYQFLSYGVSEQKCYCGAASCRGVLGRKAKKLNKKVRNKMAFEDKQDVLKLLGMMRFRSDSDDKKFDTLEDISELFYTGNMSLCQEFARLLGLQIMKDWFVNSDNEELQREIVDCISVSHFKMRNPYEEANWLGTISKWHPATYDRLKKLPLRMKIARKPFTLKDLDTKIVFEKVLEEKKEVLVKKEEITEMEKERRRLEYEAEKKRRHEEKMRMREQMLKKVEDEEKLLKFQLEAQQTMKQEADIEREEEKKREFFDKINRPNEKLEEYDLFKPYMNMDMMRVEDKVGHFQGWQ